MSDPHAYARQVFLEIRERPYRVMENLSDMHAPNCIVKGSELLQRLGILGYSVRGCVGPFDWHDLPVTPELMAAYPGDIHDTHFYVEIMGDDGTWRALDPSFDSALEKHGFRVCDWDNGKTCFPVHKPFTRLEQTDYVSSWWDNNLAEEYFKKAEPFLHEVNAWLARLRAS